MRHLSYFAKGLYYQQISRWLQLFPRENIHLIIFENFVEDFDKEISRLEDFFLQIDLKGLNLEKLNSQTDSPIDSQTYQWLWHKYKFDIEQLSKELELPIAKWYR